MGEAFKNMLLLEPLVMLSDNSFLFEKTFVKNLKIKICMMLLEKYFRKETDGACQIQNNSGTFLVFCVDHELMLGAL